MADAADVIAAMEYIKARGANRAPLRRLGVAIRAWYFERGNAEPAHVAISRMGRQKQALPSSEVLAGALDHSSSECERERAPRAPLRGPNPSGPQLLEVGPLSPPSGPLSAPPSGCSTVEPPAPALPPVPELPPAPELPPTPAVPPVPELPAGPASSAPEPPVPAFPPVPPLPALPMTTSSSPQATYREQLIAAITSTSGPKEDRLAINTCLYYQPKQRKGQRDFQPRNGFRTLR